MKKACVIGWPVRHSRSPLVHGYWLEKYAIRGAYEKVEVKPHDLGGFLENLQESGFVGCNVTVPHKEAAFALADVVSAEARAVGAANTLWLEEGRLHASNTDIYGFMTHLSESAPHWKDSNRPVMVLGAGGAARGIIYGLLKAGIGELRLANRTRQKAEELAAGLKDMRERINIVDWEERGTALKEAGLLVNTTSLGMDGQPPLELSLEHLRADGVVADIVYSPLRTPLLRAAREKGCRTVDGLGMLLHQAVPGFHQWFGKKPAVTTELRNLVIADLGG